MKRHDQTYVCVHEFTCTYVCAGKLPHCASCMHMAMDMAVMHDAMLSS